MTQGAGSNDKNPAPARADREALGRSRGGLSTKIHLLADARCRPLARVLTAGQRHDSVAFEPLMGRLRIRRRGRAGQAPDPATCWVTRRTRTAPSTLTCGDAGPSRRSRRRATNRTPAPRRAPAVAEHRHSTPSPTRAATPPSAFNKLKVFRAITLRTDKREYMFQGTVNVASTQILAPRPCRPRSVRGRLEAWLSANAPGFRSPEAMTALGTATGDFPPDRRRAT